MHPKLTVAVFALAAGFSTSAATAQTVLYVDQDAAGSTHDGSAWCTAFTDLQDALDMAAADTTIRVADGTYTPDRGTGDRTATFQLLSNVIIEGGFAGCGAPNPDERDIVLYGAILSGDLNGDDVPMPCIEDSPDCDSHGRLCIDSLRQPGHVRRCGWLSRQQRIRRDGLHGRAERLHGRCLCGWGLHAPKRACRGVVHRISI